MKQKIQDFFSRCSRHVLLWTSSLTLLACVAALLLNLYTGRELLYESFAVILGVIITAIITMLLLHGQTEKQRDADLTRENEQKRYEEKLKIYKAFLDKLFEVMKDGKIDEKEKRELIFQTASIAMHTSARNVKNISKGVSELMKMVNSTSIKEAEMLKALFDIVDSFRRELYTEPADTKRLWKETAMLQTQRENAHDAQRAALEKRHTKELDKLRGELGGDAESSEQMDNLKKRQAEERQEQEKQQAEERAEWAKQQAREGEQARETISFANELTNPYHGELVQGILQSFGNTYKDLDTSESEGEASAPEAAPAGPWGEALRDWYRNGWEKINPLSNDVYLLLQNTQLAARIEIGFYDGHYYLQASYEKTRDFSRAMKWEYKGRRSDKAWWRHFEHEFYELKQGELGDRLKTDEKLQAYLIKFINAIIGHLRHQHESYQWQERLCAALKAAHPEWLKEGGLLHIFNWYWKVLAININNIDEGTPFMDVYRDGKDNGTVVIELHNRENDEGKLRKTLERLGGDVDARLRDRTTNNRIKLAEIKEPPLEAGGMDKVADAVRGFIERLSR